MSFTLPALPYAKDALEPHISERTLSYHYDKHHATYVNKLNALIADTEFEKQPLEDIIKTSKGAIFNNAAQVWNHTFYWNCLTGAKNQEPSAQLKQAIENKFDSIESMLAELKEKALANFGSGWTWLVVNADKTLEIINTSNASCPLTTTSTAILTIDVWEHAYYLDAQNNRAKYIDSFFTVMSWDAVSANYNKAI
ncbi:MAG: superoxide dismutase [Legionellales bacterium]|jgi:superoxide dismutase, Fe-Mn family|nr:superoxide dismutase [Legionellales bacterium]